MTGHIVVKGFGKPGNPNVIFEADQFFQVELLMPDGQTVAIYFDNPAGGRLVISNVSGGELVVHPRSANAIAVQTAL